MKNSRYFFILIFTMALFILPNSTNVSAFEGRSNTFITPFSIIGEDGRTEVVNSEIMPYSSISFLFSLDSMCTGTIIDDDKVLTAAHSVYNPGTKQYYRNSTIYPGVNKDEFPFGSANSIEYIVPVQYIHSGNPKFDYAIIKLNKPIGHNIERLNFINIKYTLGNPIKVIGYLVDKLEETGKVSQYEMEGRALSEDHFNLYYDIDTSIGQSGAPILNNKNEIIGIHIGRYRTNGLNGGIKVNKVMENFIRRALEK
ncbi:hypothetical protein B4064_2873 [Caldibacillus thermoamylovorans]|nr:MULTISPECIES: trypsin-like serine protease [Bacillaceae]KIO63670.1 hypothetical protein B4065_2890 [Caldibacillus thermoamylovorans]KIO64258.1 hypothetical protein B4064_2873 [Caldibacillus thermoamylovorans]MEC5271134.1 trypsin-like peptidase domain-containing protein [Caldifermentibacillus hisashii]